MDPIEGILVKTVGNIADADLAAGHLRSHGIECVIKTDDCAGMYPSMGVIQLLVDPEMADDARKILRENSQPMEPLSETPIRSTDSNCQSSVPPRVYRFNSGMIVGLIVGALIQFNYTQYQRYRARTVQYDQDNDGVSEEEVVWRNGHYVETRLDQNADGRPDAWNHYRESVQTHGEADDNFDGQVDAWFTYSANGVVSAARLDTDFNGIADVAITYEHGLSKQADWRPNGTNVIVLRQLYRHGILREEMRDVNGDGRFDVSITYDAFNTPIRTNHLQPFLRSLP